MAILVCPECGGKVSDKAASCPHCGAPVAKTTEPSTKTCPECGNEIAIDSKVCKFCGYPFDTTQRNEVTDTSTNSNNFFIKDDRINRYFNQKYDRFYGYVSLESKNPVPITITNDHRMFDIWLRFSFCYDVKRDSYSDGTLVFENNSDNDYFIEGRTINLLLDGSIRIWLKTIGGYHNRINDVMNEIGKYMIREKEDFVAITSAKMIEIKFCKTSYEDNDVEGYIDGNIADILQVMYDFVYNHKPTKISDRYKNVPTIPKTTLDIRLEKEEEERKKKINAELESRKKIEKSDSQWNLGVWSGFIIALFATFCFFFFDAEPVYIIAAIVLDVIYFFYYIVRG